MRRRDLGLLDQIERDLLDDTKPLASTLRKCLTLGGQVRSVPLRDWASRELNGYEGSPDLPEYRRVGAPILLDGATMRGLVKRQPIARSSLPDFVQEHVDEVVELRQGVGMLEEMARSAENRESRTVDLSLPMGADLARVLNSQSDDPSQQILTLYWSVSAVQVRGILDRVRTAVVEIVSELRAGMPEDASVPSPETAAQAVNVALHGGKRNNVVVNTSQAGHDTSVTTTPINDKPESWWTKHSTIWTVIGVLVAAVGAFLTYLQLRQ